VQEEGSEDGGEYDASQALPHGAQFYRAVARTFAKQVLLHKGQFLLWFIELSSP
jgi:hypothetical protein